MKHSPREAILVLVPRQVIVVLVVMLVTVTVCFAVLAFSVPTVEAKRKPAFDVGQAYGFWWGFRDELLVIDAVLDDGWLRVHEYGQTRAWVVNTHQLLGYTHVAIGPASTPAAVEPGQIVVRTGQ